MAVLTQPLLHVLAQLLGIACEPVGVLAHLFGALLVVLLGCLVVCVADHAHHGVDRILYHAHFQQEPDLDIFWGAYLGTEDEILISGKLADVKDEIEAVRRHAREQYGWIMDTYLLRKSEPDR